MPYSDREYKVSNVNYINKDFSALKNTLIEYAKTHKNLIITPHIGGATYESMHKTEVFMAKKLSEWIKSMNAGLN